MHSSRVRLAVVGDVHGQWSPADAAALKVLQADAVLWVGEFPADLSTLVVGWCMVVGAVDAPTCLSVCMCVYAGDIGNEDVGLVQQIAALVRPSSLRLLPATPAADQQLP